MHTVTRRTSRVRHNYIIQRSPHIRTQAQKIPSTEQCSIFAIRQYYSIVAIVVFLVRAWRTTSFRANTLKKRNLLLLDEQLHHDYSAGEGKRMPAPLELTRCYVPAIGSRAICSSSVKRNCRQHTNCLFNKLHRIMALTKWSF